MDSPPRLTPRGSVYISGNGPADAVGVGVSAGNGPADAALVAAFSSNVVDKWRFLVVYYHC